MDFALSEEQTLLQDSLRGWLAAKVPMGRVREAIQGRRYDPALAGELAAQGVAGMLVGEEYGGSGLGLLDALVAAEELGRAAAPWSFHSASVMAPLAVAVAGNEEQKAKWLPEVAAGRALLSFAASAAVDGGRGLRTELPFVADATRADAFVVTADTQLYLVESKAAGVRAHELKSVDGTRCVGRLELGEVELDDSMRMSEADGVATVERLADAGRIMLAADILGAAERGLETAVEYSQTREQFGRAVGSFQAVKHMCAETVADLEPLRSLLWYAAFAWDDRREDSPVVTALLKSHAAEVGTRAVTTSVQVYGGMGFTWDCDMHIWFKRVGYDRQVLGGPEEMRERAMALQFD